MDSLSLADDLISSLSMNDSTGEDFSLYNIPFKIYACLTRDPRFPYHVGASQSIILEIVTKEWSPLRVSLPSKIPLVFQRKFPQ